MAEQEEMFETDEVVAAEDSTDSIFETKSSVVSFIEERYKRAEDSRFADEERWLRAYRNYRATIDHGHNGKQLFMRDHNLCNYGTNISYRGALYFFSCVSTAIGRQF